MKKRSHKYKHGGRVTTPYTFIFSATILVLWMISEVNHYDDTYVRENEQQVFLTPIVVDHPEDESVETKIRRYFPKSHVTMIAIANAESGMNHQSQNWNCWYNEDETTVYPTKVKNSHSTSCKKEDRHLSWSIDCGILMKNYIGIKKCPKVSVDEHLQEMAELSKARGFQPWFAWSNGSYKKFLAKK